LNACCRKLADVTVRIVVSLDGADPDPDHIVGLLDSLPGAYERTRAGIEQARGGEGVSLDHLV
jgi:hypothetical protein